MYSKCNLLLSTTAETTAWMFSTRNTIPAQTFTLAETLYNEDSIKMTTNQQIKTWTHNFLC